MKSLGQQYRHSWCAKFLAIFLLLAFLSASLTESFHHHSRPQSVASAGQISKAEHQTFVFSGQLPCKLCDFIKHGAHFYHLPATVLYSAIQTELVIKYARFVEPQRSAFRLSYTNKGPPSF